MSPAIWIAKKCGSLDRVLQCFPLFTTLNVGVQHYQESFAPKLLRWLLDQGASMKNTMRLIDSTGKVYPRVETTTSLREVIEQKMAKYVDVDKYPPSLQAMNRLLLQQDAVYAVSWLWTCKSKYKSKSTTKSSNPLPRFCWKRSTTSTSGVALRGFFRYTRKL